MKDTIKNVTKYDILLIFLGKGVIYVIIGCVVAPTNPAINAAANNVWCLK